MLTLTMGKLCKRCNTTEKTPRGQCRACQLTAKKKWYHDRVQRDPDYNSRNGRIQRTRHAVRLLNYKRERKQWLRDGDVTSKQLRELAEQSSNKCKYCGIHTETLCGSTYPVGFDHVIPMTKGGRHTISNMVVCCGPCNAIKGNRW